jgi:sugar phosphate isomerase/epimerase
MKIAGSTISYTRKNLAEALGGIASLGFKYVDLLMMENWAHINPSEIAEDPQKQAEQVGDLLNQYHLTAIGINGNVSRLLNSPVPAEIESNQKQATGLIRFAQMLSIPVVVLQPGRVSGEIGADAAMEASIRALGSMVSIAVEHGVTLTIEPHINSLAEKYDDALRFVNAVPGLKLAYDPSHFVMADYNLAASEVLLPHTAHVHLRNAVVGNFQAPMAEGILDFEWVLAALERNGYSDAIAIEYIDGRNTAIEPDILALKQLLEIRYLPKS